MLGVCRFGISFAYGIECIDLKLISVFLIIDYSLIADLHIFFYGRAKCASISLKCLKVKISILNNFEITKFKASFVSFHVRLGGGNKNIIQNRRKKTFRKIMFVLYIFGYAGIPIIHSLLRDIIY